jgi:hypothetical protein
MAFSVNRIHVYIKNYYKYFVDWLYYNLYIKVKYFLYSNNNNEKTTVHVYVLCWNESKMISYFLSHYLDFVDKVIVYDNMSDDGSYELLKNNNKVEIIRYDTGGIIDNDKYLEIKNNVWKKSRGIADYVIVCDMDEFLYSSDMLKTLSFIKKNKYTIGIPDGYEMVSDKYPINENTKKLTSLVKDGYKRNEFLSKYLIFDPNKIIEINYEPGCHAANPYGKVKYYKNNDFKLLHYDAIGKEYFIEKRMRRKQRLDENKLKKGYSLHYNHEEKWFAEEFDRRNKNKKRVIS